MPEPQTQPQVLRAPKAPTAPIANTTKSRMNLPNAMTLAGYGCSVYWLMGGSSWFAVASVLLDELDGLVARSTGQTTSYGSLFDVGTDIVLAALTGNRLGILPAMPFITAGQIYMYENKKKPPFGGMRAGLTAATLIKEAVMKKRKERLQVAERSNL